VLGCGESDATGSYGADVPAFEIVRMLERVGDVPAAPDDSLVGRDLVRNKGEDHHRNLFGNTDAIRVGDSGNGNAVLKVLAFVK
jgi:hypothetical protein